MRSLLLIGVCIAATSCASSIPPGSDPPNSLSAARVFYESYESALRSHRRNDLAEFYHSEGATIVFNGARMAMTRTGIDSLYRGPWQGPAFFAFDSLHFEPLDASSVLVTGGFTWLAQESPDTGQYIYLAILKRTPAGLKIRVEHETQRPLQRQ